MPTTGRRLIAELPRGTDPADPPRFLRLRSARLRRIPGWTGLIAGSAFAFLLSTWAVVQNTAAWDSGAVLELATVLVGSLALLAMRRFPATVTVMALAVHLANPLFWGNFIAQYALGAYGRKHWQIWSVAALSAVAQPAILNGNLGFTSREAFLGFVNVALMNLFPLIIGLYVGGRRALLVHWVERAERAEREQGLIADQARTEERNRMAREMHDSIAHHVSLVVVQSGALEMLVARDPKQAARSATTIQEVGRRALDELRQMIGVLRASPADRAPDLPRPTLQDVEVLVSDSEKAGLAADLRIEGERRTLPDHVERAAYRVIQEALTNVHKHAGGSEASVALTYEPRLLAISIRNGRPTEGFRRTLPSGGQGLIGLAERVQMVGGELDSGPLPNGGFHVTATLPTSES